MIHYIYIQLIEILHFIGTTSNEHIGNVIKNFHNDTKKKSHDIHKEVEKCSFSYIDLEHLLPSDIQKNI